MTYNADSIIVPSDVEVVRAKPGMFIGEIDSFGAYLCLKEIIDNASDEATNGYANVVYVQRDSDYGFTVWDNGRGIPIEIHKQMKVPAIQLVFCKLHAGGKMDVSGTAYTKGSVGTHGVGACVTNSMSNYLKAYSYRKGWHMLSCNDGKPTFSKCNKPPQIESERFSVEKGTLVTFQLDSRRFTEDAVIDDETVLTYLETLSRLYPGIKYIYNYHDEKLRKDFEEVFYEKTSIAEQLAKRHGLQPKQVLSIETSHVNLALCFRAEANTDKLLDHTYVCGSPTAEHGTHVAGLLKAFENAIAPYAKKPVYTEDVANMFGGLFNYTMVAPSFRGQTKQRLTAIKATKIVADEVTEPLKVFFSKNKGLIIEVIKKAESLCLLRDKHKTEMELSESVKQTKGKLNLPPKLAQAPNAKPHERELYIVEGDSAGGTAKKARFSAYQEVLPLRGKVLNVLKNAAKVGQNGPVQDVLRSIGYNKEDKKMQNSRVQGKIIILTDADSDGGHIQILLLGLLWKYFPEAFHRKMVYILDTPLYSYKHQGVIAFGNDIGEIREQVPNFKPEYLTRAKGWGSVSPEQLRNLAFDKNRRLIRVRPLELDGSPEARDDSERFYGIIAGDSYYRKAMLTR